MTFTTSDGTSGRGPVFEAVTSRLGPASVRSTVEGTPKDIAGALPVDLVGVPREPSGAAVEVDLRSRLLPAVDRVIVPPLGAVTLGVSLTPSAGGPTCATAELVDLRTGAVIPAVGARGDDEKTVCADGAGRRNLELELAPRWWTADAVDHLGVRWHLGAERSPSVRLEAAWLSWTWQDRTWLNPARGATGPLVSAPSTGPLDSADGAGLALAPLPPGGDTARVVDVGLPVPLAADAIVESATAVVVWRPLGPGRACLAVQPTTAGRTSGPVGDAVCRRGSDSVVQRVDLGHPDPGDLDGLGLRLVPSGGAGAGMVVDSVELEVTWWRI
jgi:hypothetical protein